MSHFYGTVESRQGRAATKRGHKAGGLVVHAASFEGAIKVTLYTDAKDRDCYKIEQVKWQGAGVERHIAEGKLGVADGMQPFTVVLRRSDELCKALHESRFERSHDSYTAHVQALSAGAAQDAAIQQALDAEKEEVEGYSVTSADYSVLVVFEGAQQVRLFGWESSARAERKLP